MMKRFLLEGATLVALALLCAVVANAVASRERKLALVGEYPNATRIPPQTSETVPQTPALSAGTVTETQQSTTAATTTQAITATPTTPATATTSKPVASTPTTAAPTSVVKSAAPPAAAAPAAKPASVVARFTPHPDKPYVEIGYADVASLAGAGALVLDARRTSIYEQGHIAGARPFSVWESDIDDKVNKLFAERGDPDQQAKPIVVYCSGGECEDSHMLAQKLWGIQFNNVYVYRDGFPDWQKQGGAVHTGANP